MDGPQVDRAHQAAPESDEAAAPTAPGVTEDALERVAEAFDEAAEREAEADEAIEDTLEEAVTEAVADAAVVEAVSDADIQEGFEERVAEAVESGLEGPALEAAVVQAGRDADVQEAIADAAIEEALEETIAETVVAATELEAASDAAIVEELADEVETIAAETETPAEAESPAEVVELEAPGGHDPFRGPGEWYVVHTYAGYENKVKTNLESRIHTMQMEDKIFDVHIPMEDVMEIKGGKKQVVQRKVFPGYLLVKMVYDNDSWYVVRNTPGVTGFVAAGTGSKPTPLSRREVEKILAVKKEEVKPQFRLGFEEGDVVRIISGPFADFNGTISEINLDQSKLKVLVNIFDRETPVELSFDQVAKV